MWTVLRNFLFKEIFKGCCLLFSYQGSCRSLSSDSLYRLPQRFAFVKNFFSSAFNIVLFCLPFFKWHSAVPRSFRLRVSSQPALRRFPPSSATGAILSPREGIVNVFLVFYLFQTIRTIQLFSAFIPAIFSLQYLHPLLIWNFPLSPSFSLSRNNYKCGCNLYKITSACTGLSVFLLLLIYDLITTLIQ